MMTYVAFGLQPDAGRQPFAAPVTPAKLVTNIGFNPPQPLSWSQGATAARFDPQKQ